MSDCERLTVAETVARMFLVRCSASRASRVTCLSAFFRSVMSRAIFGAPEIFPSLSTTGDMVRETSTSLPSWRWRMVS